MRYLLDTNMISQLVWEPEGPVAQRIAKLGPTAVCTSIIAATETQYGVEKRGSARLKSRVERALGALDVLPFNTPADAAYGKLRAALEGAGTPIGANDMLIAAHALAENCVVVTANVREFNRVQGLTVENWLAP